MTELQLQLELDYKEASLEFHKLALSEFEKIGKVDFNSKRLDYYLDMANVYLEFARDITYQRVQLSERRRKGITTYED